MCGIAGMLLDRDLGQEEKLLLHSMADVLQHRGPDGEGFHFGSGVGLAHRRLSIIDLNTGDQPMPNEDRTVWVVFNGEIYNFQELRKGLEAKGHQFRSRSDTEVIVHLYEEHGVDCLSRIRGMFAIAIWDERRRTLLLARDRLGIKPLFYSVRGGRLLFASELQAILLDADIPREINPVAVWEFFTYGYCAAPRTIFRDIWKLLPGEWLLAEGNIVKKGSFWNYTPVVVSQSVDRVREELGELLADAVRKHLVSDVPIGAFLSGGMDSSSIVALMREVGNLDQLVTCSIGFPEAAYNELSYAEAVARALGTDHSSYVVTEVSSDLLKMLIRGFGEPFGDSSLIPTYFVSRLARQRCTVALSGDGGDEIFAGYSFRSHRLAASLGGAASRIARVLAGNGRGAPTGQARCYGRLSRFMRLVGMSIGERYCEYHTLYPGATQLLSPDLDLDGAARAHVEQVDEMARGLKTVDPTNQMAYLGLRNHLHNDMLAKVDRMSMRVSLEVRVPFLDHLVVEYAAGIPGNIKQHGWRLGDTKFILKQVMADRIPVEVVQRRKQGFGLPASWWRDHYFAPLLSEVRTRALLRRSGIFNTAQLDRLLGSTGPEGAVAQWLLLVFDTWYQGIGSAAAPKTTLESSLAAMNPMEAPLGAPSSKRSG